jgi:hypothetical protein
MHIHIIYVYMFSTCNIRKHIRTNSHVRSTFSDDVSAFVTARTLTLYTFHISDMINIIICIYAYGYKYYTSLLTSIIYLIHVYTLNYDVQFFGLFIEVTATDLFFLKQGTETWE